MRTRRATIAALLVFGLTLTAGAATSDAAFKDPPEDQRNTERLTAPDIISIDVSNTRAGLITFRVTFLNALALPPNTRIAVLFDLDRSFSSGDLGFENAVIHVVDGDGVVSTVFERFDANEFRLVEVPAANVTSSFDGGVLTMSIPRAALGNTIGFDFGMFAAVLEPDLSPRTAAVDDAPNQNLYRYDLTGLPPPRLAVAKLTLSPKRPVSGKRFVVTSVVTRLDTKSAVMGGSVKCTARLAKKRIRASGGFRAGKPRCTMTIPRGSKGKRLTGTLTVTAAGAKITKRFSFKVG